VGRLSGEGIVILQPDLTAAEAITSAEAATEVLTRPIEVDDIPFGLDPVAGVALSPEHGRELGTLFMKAELAVGEARRNGRRAMLYVRQAKEVTDRRITLLRELHTVLRDPARSNEISVLYQPQVQLSTGELSSVEALLRWRHPQWGPIPTDELLEAVEPTDVMHMLTRHVLRLAMSQIRTWNDEGQPLATAVNVSVADLHERDFVEEVAALVKDYGVAPSQLTIEITERMLLSDSPLVTQVAGRLSRLGVGLSLDDFGSGHASLQQLRRLPLTEVKIDRSYVQGMIDSPADRAIVASVHQLARALGVSIVAEGVEDERTARALARLTGAIGQGYYFGRPMTVTALQQWRLAH
jgi:EAL domain-containing protein (putative c-di-GMP-specific phosphodiesterase class I)